MTKQTLPKLIEPLRLVERGTVLSGELSLQTMPRLGEMIAERTGSVQIDLQFAKNQQGLAGIYGRIRCLLVLRCQRCMRPLHCNFDIAVKLSPVRNDTVDLPQGYEPLLVTDEPMLLSEIIEDELLLNLPLVPKHEVGQCPTEAMEH